MQENASYLNRKLNSYLYSLLYNSSLDTVILEWEYWKIVQNNFSSRIKIQSNWGLTSSLPVSVCLAAWYSSSPCHFRSFFFFCRFSAPLPNKSRWWGKLEKDDTVRCGWANGGVKKLQSKSFSPQKKPVGSEKQRFTKLF